MNTRAIQLIGSRATGGMLGTAMVFALMLTTARHAGAQEQESDRDYEQCMDAAWADLNRCLMTTTCWLSKLECDLLWAMDSLTCFNEEIR